LGVISLLDCDGSGIEDAPLVPALGEAAQHQVYDSFVRGTLGVPASWDHP
jgi:hypothetical protein